jgi:crotonobetainyl-CoA:carnitine CoA-transferase CaiB-like acyl-CoA transferase
MSNNRLVPEGFGPLQGVRIVSSGTVIAQPFAATLAAEMGAEVIQIERPEVGDAVWRTIGIRLKTRDGSPPVSTNWIQERRNMFCVTLDLSKPRGRELFLRLVERAEIWMESSKAGTYRKWNLDDQTVLERNPKLVITHVSGYGQSGDPDYVNRAAYDIVGQAFSGMMYQTGFPEPTPPTRAAPWTADYMTALYALWSSLAGLIHARETGRGQVVDVAMFEVIHHTLGSTMLDYFEGGVVRERSGNKAQGFQPLDTFQAADGWVAIAALSASFDRLCRVIGLNPEEPKWQSAQVNLESVEGVGFDALLRGWIGERTVSEVVRVLNEARVGCARIVSSKDIADDPHYKARAVHVEWTDEQVGSVKGTGIAPGFSVTPGKIWRGSVKLGHDNDRIYGELLGLNRTDLERLKREQVI